jgi:glycosyltransferase involved in cell wall biosynthesis
VASTGGRAALPLSWLGARRAGVPLILWTSLWAHPRSAVHALSYVALRRVYASADAVVTYGPHVSAYVRARGARNVYAAPQSVDNAYWREPPTEAPHAEPWPPQAAVKFLFVGRAAREKGLQVLLRAWPAVTAAPAGAALALVGVERTVARPTRSRAGDAGNGLSAGVTCAGWVEPAQLRNFYGAADVLVVPSIATRTFREPWGLVINEAFNQQLAVITTDAVGAAAGGLVRDGANGLVVPAGDVGALAKAMQRLANDPALRKRMGETGATDVRAYTYESWADGFSAALRSVGASLHRTAGAGRAGSVA